MDFNFPEKKGTGALGLNKNGGSAMTYPLVMSK